MSGVAARVDALAKRAARNVNEEALNLLLGKMESVEPVAGLYIFCLDVRDPEQREVLRGGALIRENFPGWSVGVFPMNSGRLHFSLRAPVATNPVVFDPFDSSDARDF